jgi:hypothetical protein
VGTGRSSNFPSLGHLGGVHFRSLQEQLDTGTSGGELVFHVFGALGEFERDLIRERTMAGLAAARARGRRGGRRGLTAEKGTAVADVGRRESVFGAADLPDAWGLAGYVLSICESARGVDELDWVLGIARNLWLGRLPS